MSRVEEIRDKSSSQIRLTDLVAPTRLLDRFKNEQDQLSQYLCSKLPMATVKLIMQYAPSSKPDEKLLNALVADLNELLRGPLLYDPKEFAHVSLRTETRKALVK